MPLPTYTHVPTHSVHQTTTIHCVCINIYKFLIQRPHKLMCSWLCNHCWLLQFIHPLIQYVRRNEYLCWWIYQLSCNKLVWSSRATIQPFYLVGKGVETLCCLKSWNRLDNIHLSLHFCKSNAHAFTSYIWTKLATIWLYGVIRDYVGDWRSRCC